MRNDACHTHRPAAIHLSPAFSIQIHLNNFPESVFSSFTVWNEQTDIFVHFVHLCFKSNPLSSTKMPCSWINGYIQNWVGWKQEQTKGCQEMLTLKTSLIKWLYPFQVLAVTETNVNNKHIEDESDSFCPGENRRLEEHHGVCGSHRMITNGWGIRVAVCGLHCS